jgi:hypothetical protein
MGTPSRQWGQVDGFIDKTNDVLREHERITAEAQSLLPAKENP